MMSKIERLNLRYLEYLAESVTRDIIRNRLIAHTDDVESEDDCEDDDCTLCKAIMLHEFLTSK